MRLIEQLQQRGVDDTDEDALAAQQPLLSGLMAALTAREWERILHVERTQPLLSLYRAG